MRKVKYCVVNKLLVIHLQSIHRTVTSQTESRPQKTQIYLIVLYICCDSEYGV